MNKYYHFNGALNSIHLSVAFVLIVSTGTIWGKSNKTNMSHENVFKKIEKYVNFESK